ncbi:methyltransferase domain-containing protein [uncultured Jannaschia sp.]|uniref:class I SAM-dependent methyltransferase n=1 Tax=uncultured Jannaschia sp. TaxID=293347 RepID=UPI002638A3EB|nr:methyltransferase domain-containing protein [uncultured Jannaschia sp.]
MSAPSCRVCAAKLDAPDFDDPGPSLTSIRTVLDLPTRVWLCENCGHAQSPDLPELSDFYDTQYRISLDIDGHDQLYENAAGEQVFRTAYQAELVAALEITNGAKVLDFGAGKATTLQRVIENRPDIQPHVFDVSRDYTEHWAGWVPEDQQATYALPDGWTDRFDLITAHFVLEHVPDPVAILHELSRCLAPGGRLFLSVPDCGSNTGDLLVVDHLNHFTAASLTRAFAEAGLRIDSLDQTSFAGAFIVVATGGTPGTVPARETDALRSVLADWTAILHRLRTEAPTEPVAIYGAGFYGTLIATRIAGGPRCFLDRNPYLQGHDHMGAPVLIPEDCPTDIASIVVGLNPARARTILADTSAWRPADARLIWLDG